MFPYRDASRTETALNILNIAITRRQTQWHWHSNTSRSLTNVKKQHSWIFHQTVCYHWNGKGPDSSHFITETAAHAYEANTGISNGNCTDQDRKKSCQHKKNQNSKMHTNVYSLDSEVTSWAVSRPNYWHKHSSLIIL